jgi:hypothetical protein
LLQAPLTVLFGRSGLGKTSLLKPACFPTAPQRMLPVYTPSTSRLAPVPHAASIGSLSTRDQLRGCRRRRTGRFGAPRARQSMWEYLPPIRFPALECAESAPSHRVFVVDQFEEVFTLGATQPAAVAPLAEDLADLIENRIPVATEARVAADEPQVMALRCARSANRVLLSFREISPRPSSAGTNCPRLCAIAFN